MQNHSCIDHFSILYILWENFNLCYLLPDGKQNCGISQPLSFTLPWQIRSSEGQTVGQAPAQLVPSTPVGPVFGLKKQMI